jgi:nucleoside-diphosphate-sugar epimerase
MNVLVTGANGFLGGYVTRQFLDLGCNVTAFDFVDRDDRIESKFHRETAEGRLRFIRGDIRKPDQVRRAVQESGEGPIVHLAGILTIGSDKDPDRAIEVNFNGTHHVLEAALAHGNRRVVFGSTISVHGRGLPQPITENMPTEPDGWYGLTKIMAEQMGLLYVRRHGLDFRAVRMAAVTGPGRSAASGSASLYTSFIPEKAALGKPYVIEVAPETAYPVVYVKDAADAIVRLARQQEAPSRIYNISSGRLITSELVETVTKRIPDAQLTYRPDPMVMAIVEGFNDWHIDCARAERELGWRPQYEVAAMVDDIIDEARKSRNAFP